MSLHPLPDEPEPCSAEILDADIFAAPLRREIAEQGWTIAGAAAEGCRPSWLYTIGLTAAHDHPEFVVVDPDERRDGVFLALLALRVADGEQFRPGQSVRLGRTRVELGRVHPRHFQLDTFDLWAPLMGMCSHHFRQEALQVFPDPGPGEPHPRLWRLDRPRPIGSRSGVSWSRSG